MIFKEFFEKEIEENNTKFYYKYLGINKKEYPKWKGWDIINFYKQQGININNIDDPNLKLLVKNFYMLKYLIEIYEISKLK